MVKDRSPISCIHVTLVPGHEFPINCGSQHGWKNSFRFQAGLEPGTLCFSIMVLDHPTMPACYRGLCILDNNINAPGMYTPPPPHTHANDACTPFHVRFPLYQDDVSIVLCCTRVLSMLSSERLDGGGCNPEHGQLEHVPRNGTQPCTGITLFHLQCFTPSARWPWSKPILHRGKDGVH